MKTQRYHFSVPLAAGSSQRMHAYVPVEGGEEIALARVKADDPLWLGDVKSHGLVDWFEQTSFHVMDEKIWS